MAWTECEIDEVLEQTIRTLRDSGDTAGGVNLTVPAAELSKENMDALGDLIVEHARRQADPVTPDRAPRFQARDRPSPSSTIARLPTTASNTSRLSSTSRPQRTTR
ncbi:hypothetical protein GS485_20715 [Rhodococcus hoagii]|nr:hypothetical protein [Prescottella equi]